MNEILMYHAMNATEVEDFFMEISNPLDLDQVRYMRDVQADRDACPDDDDELKEDWFVCLIECTVCLFYMTSVIPGTNSLENLECDACGRMTCEIKKEIDYGNTFTDIEFEDLEEELDS